VSDEEQKQPKFSIDDFSEMPVKGIKMPERKESSGKVTLLNWHAAVTPKKTPLDILKHVLIKDGRMYSTDLEVVFETAAPSELTDGVYLQSKDVFIPKKNIPIEDFPHLQIEGEWECKFTIANDQHLFASLLEFASTDKDRPALAGANVVIGDGFVRLAATDGHILIQREVPATILENKRDSIFLDSALLKSMLRDKESKELTIGLYREQKEGGTCLVIVAPDTGNYKLQFKSDNMERGRTFPNLMRVFPTGIEHQIEFNRHSLYEALTIAQTSKKALKDAIDVVDIVNIKDKTFILFSSFDKSVKLRIPINVINSEYYGLKKGAEYIEQNLVYYKDERSLIEYKEYPNFILMMPGRPGSKVLPETGHIISLSAGYLLTCMNSLLFKNDSIFIAFSDGVESSFLISAESIIKNPFA
jgi:cellobiose-specific phosphotransferase system component IIB